MGNMAKYAAEQLERIERYTSVRNAAIVLDEFNILFAQWKTTSVTQIPERVKYEPEFGPQLASGVSSKWGVKGVFAISGI